MASTSKCIICEKTLIGDTVVVKKGLENLIAVSKARKDEKYKQFVSSELVEVHKVCRREYIKERNISQFLKRKKEDVSRMSQKREQFNFMTL